MTLPEIILLAVVLAVGVPASRMNLTAGALVLSYAFVKLTYYITGDGLAVEFYLYPDFFVLGCIMAKTEACNLRPYRSTLHQLECVLLERSPADRVVMLIFPLVWATYLFAESQPFYTWWLLWSLSVAQFLAAGWEGFPRFRRNADAVKRRPGDPGHPLLVAYPGGGRLGQ